MCSALYCVYKYIEYICIYYAYIWNIFVYNNVLCTARINKYSVCRTLYIIQCTMYTVLCTACNNNYSVRRTLYSVHRQCTLYYAYY